MSRDQLELVQQLAERQEKEAASRLASAQGALANAQSQLSQVLSYREDYHRLAVGEGGSVIDTNQLQTARHFYPSSIPLPANNKRRFNRLNYFWINIASAGSSPNGDCKLFSGFVSHGRRKANASKRN